MESRVVVLECLGVMVREAEGGMLRKGRIVWECVGSGVINLSWGPYW